MPPPCVGTELGDRLQNVIAHGWRIHRGLSRSRTSDSMSAQLQVPVCPVTPQVIPDEPVTDQIRPLEDGHALHHCTKHALINSTLRDPQVLKVGQWALSRRVDLAA